MFTALVSLLTNRPVHSNVAMTGEISLRGLVLPIGGVKEKVLAALRAGITTVMLPARNRRDLDDIPAEARDKLSAALKKVVASKDYTDFMGKQGYGVIFAGPDDFAKFMAKSDTELGATMKAVGLAK